MRTVSGKLMVLRAVVNMMRVLIAMSARLPDITWGVGQEFIGEQDGQTISRVINNGGECLFLCC